MKIRKYKQVSFVVVRFIHWLSETKNSEKVRFENIPKSEKEPGFNQSEES
jgi:hypothetical protein